MSAIEKVVLLKQEEREIKHFTGIGSHTSCCLQRLVLGISLCTMIHWYIIVIHNSSNGILTQCIIVCGCPFQQP